ncbi:MAG: alpha-2-macroglobulin [Kiritimatiellae bacterium]|nr:alpha-2-macroglobulin [Kiritimatiellia bacterium]
MALTAAGLLAFAGVPGAAGADAEQVGQKRQAATRAYKDGNYKDALASYQELALDPANDPRMAGQDVQQALQCLRRLQRVNETDAFLEKVAATHAASWPLLFAAAEGYIGAPHDGYIVAGAFQRGPHRGGGRWVSSHARDRIRALQLMVQALPHAEREPQRRLLGQFYLRFAQMLLYTRHGQDDSWPLQVLSDLAELPDYEEGYYHRGQAVGAAVHPDGTPVFYKVPNAFENAASDGERWRWLLVQAMETAPERTNEVLYTYAQFLRRQFGVQTMASFGRYFQRGQPDDEREDESGTYALHTLGEDETITRLAVGIRRFKLPADFNFIRLYRRIAEAGKSSYGRNALEQLAQIFEDRRQYAEAAELWQRNIREYGSTAHKQQRLDQIVGNWGQFEPIMSQAAGKGATVEYRFRNGTDVRFEAHRILVQPLLDDVKAYLKSNPRQLDWNTINIGNIGYRLVQDGQDKYLGKQVANWELALKPRPAHFDKRTTVTTPLSEAGAYLLTARMAGGNTSRIVVWLSDTAIVKKPLDDGAFCYVGDACSGAPVPKAHVEFFGYRQESVKWDKLLGRHYNVLVDAFARQTDEQGQLLLTSKELPRNHNWLITATTPNGRFAYLGFSHVWYSRYHDRDYHETKVFVVTDRPVYRPKQPVKFKFWVRQAKYDQEDKSFFANQSFTARINDPKGEKVFEQSYTADAYGGFDGEFLLPADATLGPYTLHIPGRSGGHFRVEEYKKPEFEVTVEAPTEPVMLGETVTATITAKYYFGAPVTQAKVKYKVQRTGYSANWYPIGIWDWFYEPGYWWFAYDYTWYPGWKEWGCFRPPFWWWPARRDPPELVMENDVEIGADGTVTVEIDTGLAKELHGDTDHQYELTAEVVDESRRTIVGQGKVLVARKPFKVYAWVDRGHYRVGDTIRADFSAQTLDNKPVQGKGTLTLFRISYGKNREPQETAAQTWPLDTDAQGKAQLQMQASRAGQYRLAYTVTDAKGHAIEGGYVFVIRGEGFDGAAFRFNPIELVTDKREYAPGETARVMVNTDRVGGTVVLFVRPANGVYLPPRIIAMQGKSTVHQLAITKKDMPNFFIEAFTISDGKVHGDTREIIVPPEKRVLNVDVQPSATAYKPGEQAKLRVKLTDFFGQPFVGSLVMSLYDKSVEYISGGSNVPEIKSFFWKWRRRHTRHEESSLQRHFSHLLRPKERGMGYLGAFGHTVADELGADLDGQNEQAYHRLDRAKGGMGGARLMKAAAPMAPAEMKEEGLAMADAEAAPQALGAAGGGAAPEPLAQPTVRKAFADTALWVAALDTNPDGIAEVELTMPENLTGWKLKTWAMGHGTKVGEGTSEIVTKKNLMLRMQAPRFFVEKDEVVLSANVHNYLKTDKTVKARLALDGPCLEAMTQTEQSVIVAADGEKRVDWRVKVVKEGEAVIRMLALTDEESDAMEMRFPVYVHGMLKTESFSGVVRREQGSAAITVKVPAERRIDESRLEIRYSPSLAAAMVDALPYMVEYPYGCTEQTLNRFLPTVVTQKILLDMGLELKAIREKRTNLNAQEIGDDPSRAKQWKRWNRNPVFDEETVRDMVREGVKRLTAMQLADGGWGWFSGWGERAYPHTTAYVVHGLQVARENDVALPAGVLERGVEWLAAYQADQIRRLKNAPTETDPWKRHADNLDAFVYMVLVDAGKPDADMREFLYRDRNDLSVYGKAMFGLALHKQQEPDKLNMIMRNIEQYLVRDEENQTAWLNLPNGHYWWCWYGSEFEAHACYLKLLARTDPKGWKAAGLVKYLLNNRKHATYWNSTRDTALCIEAMADYMRASEEHKPDLTVQVLIDGRLHKEVRITAENLFTFDNTLVLEGDAVETGEHRIEFRKQGSGPLYFNAYLTNFTLEDFIAKAGLEVKVNRKLYRLVKVDKAVQVAGSHGQAVAQKVEKYERRELANLATLKSGDLVEIELEIESKNDYEYLVFEDMKAAGFEPVEVRSGYAANGLGAYMELRDERVAFFVRWLARGTHSVAYRMRAEIPGRFSALPARAYAMYAPELKGNSDEIKLGIED